MLKSSCAGAVTDTQAENSDTLDKSSGVGAVADTQAENSEVLTFSGAGVTSGPRVFSRGFAHDLVTIFHRGSMPVYLILFSLVYFRYDYKDNSEDMPWRKQVS